MDDWQRNSGIPEIVLPPHTLHALVLAREIDDQALSLDFSSGGCATDTPLTRLEGRHATFTA